MDIPLPRARRGHHTAGQPSSRSVSAAKPGTSLHIDPPVSMISHASTRLSGSSRPSRSGKDRERQLKPKDRHTLALKSIRNFLKGRSSYDVLPVSFRLVILDTKLVVKPALDVMWQAGVVSAPLWQSTPPALLGPSADEAAAVGGTNEADTEADDPGASQNADGPSAADAAAATDAQGEAAAATLGTAEQAEEEGATAAEGSTQAEEVEDSTVNTATTAAAATPSGASVDAGQVSPKTQLDGDEGEAATDAALQPTSTQAKGPTATGQQQVEKRYPESGFAGMLTVSDIIHLIQYYYHHSSYDSAAEDVEKFRLERLRDIEQALNVPPPPLLSVHPLRPVFDACQLLIKTHARRLPLLDYDEQTGLEAVVSVLTQYRVLKFIAMNCRETAGLWRSLRSLGIGTYSHAFKVSRSRASASGTASHRGSDASEPGLVKTDYGAAITMSEIEPTTTTTAAESSETSRRASEASAAASDSAGNGAGVGGAGGVPDPLMQSPISGISPTEAQPHFPLATATLDTTVFDVVHMFSERGISAVPILDDECYVVDMYETVDVITLVRTGAYTALDLTIRQALERRPPDFGGIWTCSPDDSLADIFALLRKRRVHRWLILEPETSSAPSFPSSEHKSATSSEADPNGSHHDPLDDFDSDEEVVEDAATKERKRHEAIINDPTLSLDDRLDSGDPVRRTRGKLVGILCLSDLLKYVIGSQPATSGHSPAASGEGGPTASAGPGRDSSSTSRSRDASVTSEVGVQVRRRGSNAGGSSLAGGNAVVENAARKEGQREGEKGTSQPAPAPASEL